MQKNLSRKSKFKSVIVGFAAGFSPASSTGNGAVITVDSERNGSPRNTGSSTIRACKKHLPEDWRQSSRLTFRMTDKALHKSGYRQSVDWLIALDRAIPLQASSLRL